MTLGRSVHLRPLFRAFNPPLHSVAAALLLATTFAARHAFAVTTQWIGPDQGLWNNSLNWSNGLPTSSLDVLMDAPGSITSVVSSTISTRNISIAAGDGITIQGGNTVMATGTTVFNAGVVVIQNNGIGGQLLFSSGAGGTVSGAGTMTLLGGRLSAIGGASSISSDNLITGSGQITAPRFLNTGTISATTGTLQLSISANATNNGLFSAQNATLSVSLSGNSPALDNSNGVLDVGSQGVIAFNKGLVTGGTFHLHDGGTINLLASSFLNTSIQSEGGTLLFQSTSNSFGTSFSGSLSNSGDLVLGFQNTSSSSSPLSTFSGPMTNSGLLHFLNNTRLALNTSNISNEGTLSLDAALISMPHSMSIGGSGVILMNSSASQITQYVSGQTPPEAVLTLNQPLSGRGLIGEDPRHVSRLKIINNSTITATTGSLMIYSGAFFFASGDKTSGFTNNGALVADGGTLGLNANVSTTNAFCDNTNGVILAINNSTMLVGGYVKGGTITARDASTIRLNSTFESGNLVQSGSQSNFIFSKGNYSPAPLLIDVSLEGAFDVDTGATLFLQGTISNAGTITLKNPYGLTFMQATSLTGGGTIILENSSGSTISMSGVAPFESNNTFRGGAARIFPSGVGPFINNGLFDATGSFGFTFTASNAAGLFINNGTLRANGGPIILNGSANTTYLNNGLIQAMPGNSVLINSPVIGGTLSSLGLIQLAATTKVNELQISSDTQSAFTAALDVKNSNFILQSNPTMPADKSAKLSFLQSALTSGMNNGNWLGMGITSSTVAADQSATGSHLTALALFDNANLNFPTFGGQPVDTSSLLITTALIGDTNFDNTVNQSDFNLVAAKWQTPQSDWTTGDLNNDGFVDLLDAVMVATHVPNPLNLSAAPPDLAAEIAALTVPEPASLLFAAPALFAFLRRPKKSKKRALKSR